jgi:RHS repeat-associated protein
VDHGSGIRVTYTYDNDYRLTREHRTGSTPFDITYTYDDAGNRTGMLLNSTSATTYTYDARNALTEEEDSSGVTTYQYDNRGSRTAKITSTGTTTYTYDIESRLTRIDTPTASPLATYVYDAFGERVDWTKDSTLVTETWDHCSVLSRDEGGTRTRYVLTPSELIGRALSQDKGGTSVLVCNSVGTTDSQVDKDPKVLGTLVLTAFGENKASDGLDTVLRFCGRIQMLADFDGDSDELELLFLRARHYDPLVGRYMQRDPIGSWGDLRSLGNAYTHVANDPVNRVDPMGYQARNGPEIVFQEWDEDVKYGGELGPIIEVVEEPDPDAPHVLPVLALYGLPRLVHIGPVIRPASDCPKTQWEMEEQVDSGYFCRDCGSVMPIPGCYRSYRQVGEPCSPSRHCCYSRGGLLDESHPPHTDEHNPTNGLHDDGCCDYDTRCVLIHAVSDTLPDYLESGSARFEEEVRRFPRGLFVDPSEQWR